MPARNLNETSCAQAKDAHLLSWSYRSNYKNMLAKAYDHKSCHAFYRADNCKHALTFLLLRLIVVRRPWSSSKVYNWFTVWECSREWADASISREGGFVEGTSKSFERRRASLVQEDHGFSDLLSVTSRPSTLCIAELNCSPSHPIYWNSS